MQHKIFCVREFIKTESATAVQRAFRLRFSIQPPNEEEYLSLESPIWANRAVCVQAKAPADHVYQRRTWDELKRVLSVAHAIQPVERAENLEYRNQLSGLCWGVIKTYGVSLSFWITLYISQRKIRKTFHSFMGSLLWMSRQWLERIHFHTSNNDNQNKTQLTEYADWWQVWFVSHVRMRWLTPNFPWPIRHCKVFSVLREGQLTTFPANCTYSTVELRLSWLTL